MEERESYGTRGGFGPVGQEASQAWAPQTVTRPPRLDDVTKLAPWVMGLSIAYAISQLVGFAAMFGPSILGLVVSFLVTPVSLAAIVLGIVWTFQVRRNADLVAGHKGPWGPTWGIVGWIVPLAQLVVPYLVMSETWRRTMRSDRVPGWFRAWWSLWAGSLVLSYINGTRTMVLGLQHALQNQGAAPAPPSTAFEDPFTLALALGTYLLMLAALPFWLRVVRDLSSRQDTHRRAAITQAPLHPAH